MELIPQQIASPDGIGCSYYRVAEYETSHVSDGIFPHILVVAFSGVYPDGSRGNEHGHFIANSTLLGLVAFDPWCVILDFRDLRYEWGNTLLGVFDVIERYMRDDPGDPPGSPFPVVVVTSDKCRNALLSLVARSGTEPEWHFSEMDAAIDFATMSACKWIDS